MTTINPFDLLGDNDNDDPLQLLESASAHLQKSATSTVDKKTSSQFQQQKAVKLPSKPLPPSQAVREARNDSGRGGGRGSGRGGGRGRGGYRDYSNNENAFNSSVAAGPQGDGEGGRDSERRAYGGPRPPYRGGRRGGFNNEEGRDGDRPRRTYERNSGTGRGNEFKREGSGRGNWGSQSDEVAPGTEEVAVETEKNVNAENLPTGEEAVDGNKEPQPDETEEKEPEEKEMTLEEYEKVREEKRKALLALKTEGRKVEVDKDLQSMQQLSSRRDEESVFIKLASDKDKRKDASDKEKVKKSVSINEFLKPADGERYNPGGRGRGRVGRGPRGGGGGGSGTYGGGRMANASAPIIEDQKQFPTLGGAPRA
ncbi:hypothetical protein RND81_01G183700 [Saponaria officinalis]|uniref:Hyaluronan/mRNA-binding protein domain-containing protein n=1 Tax=Saponaria officinalis TaxID=3572 RepID=A0AAW1NFC3_SAPOF